MDIYGVNATVRQQGASGRSPDGTTEDTATNVFSDFLAHASSAAAGHTDPSAQMTDTLVKSMDAKRSQREPIRPRKDEDRRDTPDVADKDARTDEVEETPPKDRTDAPDKTDDAPAEPETADASSPEETPQHTAPSDTPAVPGQGAQPTDGQVDPTATEQNTASADTPTGDDDGADTGPGKDTDHTPTAPGDTGPAAAPQAEAGPQAMQTAQVQTPTAAAGAAGAAAATVDTIAASAAKAGRTDTSGTALKTGMQQPTTSTTAPVADTAGGKSQTAGQGQEQAQANGQPQANDRSQATPRQTAAGKTAGDRSATAQAQADGIAQRIGEAGEGRTVRVQVASQGQATTQADVRRQAQPAQSKSDPTPTGPAVQATTQNAAYYAGTIATGGNAGQGQQKGSLGQQAAQHMAESKADASPQQASGGPAAQAVQAQAKAAPGGGEGLGRGTPQVNATTSTTGGGPGMTSTATTPSADGLQAGQGQPGQQASQTQQTAQAQQSQPSARSSTAQVQVTEQVKVKIAQNAANGQDTIKIQLKPADLGRVDVKLHMHDGRVTAHVVADHRDTLDMLKADSRGLEQALKDAGLKPDSGSLSFSLRGDGNPQMAQNGNQGGGRDRGPANPYGAKAQSLDDDLGPIDAEMARSHAATARGGVDVRV